MPYLLRESDREESEEETKEAQSDGNVNKYLPKTGGIHYRPKQRKSVT